MNETDSAISIFVTKWLLVFCTGIVFIHSVRTVFLIEQPLQKIASTIDEHTILLNKQSNKIDKLLSASFSPKAAKEINQLYQDISNGKNVR